jgi:hypothetical protein
MLGALMRTTPKQRHTQNAPTMVGRPHRLALAKKCSNQPCRATFSRSRAIADRIRAFSRNQDPKRTFSALGVAQRGCRSKPANENRTGPPTDFRRSAQTHIERVQARSRDISMRTMKTGKRLSPRKIAQELADAGLLNERGLIFTKDVRVSASGGVVQSTRNISLLALFMQRCTVSLTQVRRNGGRCRGLVPQAPRVYHAPRR